MKKTLFIAILLFSGLVSPGQEVQFSPAVVSAGGSSSPGGAVNLSRWRIGQINVVTFPSAENIPKQATIAASALSERPIEEWSVTVYPNPVNTLLNVRFDMESRGEFTLELYDVRGRKLIAENALIILPGQVAEIDLTGLKPALYLLKVIPSVQGTQKLFKITKQ